MISIKSKEMIHEAYELHQAGNILAAEQLYKEILKDQPEHIDALFLLGTLNLQQGYYDTASIFFRKTLTLIPSHVMALCNLGTALQRSGNFDEALSSFRKAISLRPDYADAHYNLGNALKEQGKLEEAIICYKEAIELRPNHADVHYYLGNTFRELGNLDKAVECYRKSSELDPDNAGFHCNLGAALQESEILDDAIISYKEAVRLNPNYAMAFSNLGYALQQSGKLEEAITCQKRAVELNPDCAESRNILGTALMEQGELDNAVSSYQKALLLEPEYTEAHNNLGTALMKQDKFDAAIISYKKSIELKPESAEAYNNLGTVLKASGNPEEAITHYEQAIELKPDYAQAHINLAFALLLTENFKRGLEEYEWRPRLKECASDTDKVSMWDGSPINGKSILVYTEQGVGDSIQFVRYLPMIKAQGGKVIFECQKSLLRLLENYPGIDRIIEKSSNTVPEVQLDFHIPLLSLPGIFGTNPDSIPQVSSYISPDPLLTSQWRTKFEHDNNLKIGIVWAGNPEHINDRNRSCTLNDFVHLTSIQGLTLYSLQQELTSSKTNNEPEDFNIVNLGNELNDFADTASVIDNLDLVITVDTAVAHLAGAIGKPVWTLLSFVPDWRWMLNREDSPWYPSMRLFRQAELNDWAGVFNQVKKALLQEIDNLNILSVKSAQYETKHLTTESI